MPLKELGLNFRQLRVYTINRVSISNNEQLSNSELLLHILCVWMGALYCLLSRIEAWCFHLYHRHDHHLVAKTGKDQKGSSHTRDMSAPSTCLLPSAWLPGEKGRENYIFFISLLLWSHTMLDVNSLLFSDASAS